MPDQNSIRKSQYLKKTLQATIELSISSNKKSSYNDNNHVDLLFLYASPNLFIDQNKPQEQKSHKHYNLLPALDFRKESKTIKQALEESKK